MKTHIFIILSICFALAYDKEFSGPAYQGQTAQQKLDQLWTEITADQTPYGWYSAFSLVGIFIEDMKKTFDTYSDVMPEGRKKLVHSVGSVVKAEFIAEKGNPYSGVFQGASNVLIRISMAKEPNPKEDAEGNFTPGMGIKLLRDGVPSANLVAMFGVDGQDSWNAFKYDWSNHIPNSKAFSLKLLAKKFSEATPHVGRIGLKTWAEYDEKGQSVNANHLKFPYKLVFSPTEETRKRFPDTYDGVLTEQLKTIPAGTILYDVLAVQEPAGPAVKIGTLKSKSQFVTSKFGDKDLFFQHNYIEDDIALCPSWKAAIEVDPPIVDRFVEQ